MATVNPPPALRKPSDWQKNPEIRAYIDAMERIIFQLYQRTGGSTDIINNISSSETFETSVTAGEAQERADDNEQIEDFITHYDNELNAIVTITSYTAVNKDWVEARSRSTIYLDEYADPGDEIIVANGDGTDITVTSSVCKIKYKVVSNSLILANEGTSLLFKLFSYQDELYWRAI